MGPMFDSDHLRWWRHFKNAIGRGLDCPTVPMVKPEKRTGFPHFWGKHCPNLFLSPVEPAYEFPNIPCGRLTIALGCPKYTGIELVNRVGVAAAFVPPCFAVRAHTDF